MRRICAAVAVGLAALLSGCGGGSGGGALQPSAVEACLEDRFDVESDEEELDFIAQDAGLGALEVDFDERQSATLYFERNGSDAKDTAAALETFSEGFGGDPGEKLRRYGNVVVAWSKSPTDEEQEALEACLD